MNKKKLTVGFVVTISLVLIGCLIVLGSDYYKYDNYQKSMFFGSKDVYSQNQPLYFNDLKLTIKSVKHKRHDYQTVDSCFEISQQAGAMMRANGFVETPEWQVLSMKSKNCLDVAQAYERSKIIEVYYTLENTSSKPLDISSYDIKIHGDEKSESATPSKKLGLLLANQSYDNSFKLYEVPLKSNGPYAMLVSSGDITKQIRFSLPGISPFCISSECDVEIFSRSWNSQGQM